MNKNKVNNKLETKTISKTSLCPYEWTFSRKTNSGVVSENKSRLKEDAVRLRLKLMLGRAQSPEGHIWPVRLTLP